VRELKAQGMRGRSTSPRRSRSVGRRCIGCWVRKPTTDGRRSSGERCVSITVVVTQALRRKIRHPLVDEVFLSPSLCRHSACWLCDIFDIRRKGIWPAQEDFLNRLMPNGGHRNRRVGTSHDTRAIQGWLGHRSITSTAVYTALAPNRFKDIWRGASTPVA
jgi:integrase